MNKLLRIKAILNKRNGQIAMSPSKKSLKEIDVDCEEKILRGKRMILEFRGWD